MMASRGMGAIRPSKMPKGKTVVRKDNPNDVEVYKEGRENGSFFSVKDSGAVELGMAEIAVIQLKPETHELSGVKPGKAT